MMLHRHGTLALDQVTRGGPGLGKLLIWVAAAVLPWSALIATGRLLMAMFG